MPSGGRPRLRRKRVRLVGGHPARSVAHACRTCRDLGGRGRQRVQEPLFERLLHQLGIIGREPVLGGQCALGPACYALLRWQLAELAQETVPHRSQFIRAENRRRAGGLHPAAGLGRCRGYAAEIAIRSPIPTGCPRGRPPARPASTAPLDAEVGAGAHRSGASRSSSPAMPTSVNRA